MAESLKKDSGGLQVTGYQSHEGQAAAYKGFVWKRDFFILLSEKKGLPGEGKDQVGLKDFVVDPESLLQETKQPVSVFRA